MSKRPLVPRFLNRFDHRLMITKPDSWSTRAHFVIYYSLLFSVTLTVVSFIIPDDPRSNSPVIYWVGFVSVISLLSLVVWLIYLLRFNTFKRYGVLLPLSRVKMFLLYFISVGSLALFPLVMPLVESYRANNTYGDAEVINDANAINKLICQLEYDSLPHQLKQDTLHVVNTLPHYRSMPDEETVTDTVTSIVPAYRPHFRTTDTASLHYELMSADSVVKTNDTMYLLYNAFSYTFVSTLNYYYNDSIPHEDSDFDLYRTTIQNFHPVDRRKTREQLYVLLNKYRIKSNRPEYYTSDSDDDYTSRIAKMYNLFAVNNSLRNISERKYRWSDNNIEGVFRFWYYVTLIVTLLIFIYRHSTIKTFFLSGLAAIILFILTILFVTYFFQGSNSSYLFYGVVGYTVLFFIISLQAFKSRVRNELTGICINLFVLLISFFPSALLISYYFWEVMNATENTEPAQGGKPVYMGYEEVRQYMWCAEIAGFLLLLILMATYIQKVYRQWYALPEE